MTSTRLIGAAALVLLVTACTHGPGMGSGVGAAAMPAPGAWGMGAGMGMMGGAHGPGMMTGHAGGLWGLERLDLSSEQRSRIAAVQDEAWRQMSALMNSLHAQGGPRHGLFDDAGERRVYEQMAAHHKQMFELHLLTRKRLLDLLTPAQRDQLGQGWGR